MNQGQNIIECFFKLLIPATEPSLSDKKIIMLCGEPWELVDFKSLAVAPPYTCVSYSWGDKRTVNMLGNNQKISDRTLPVIESLINAIQLTECQESVIESMFNGERFDEKIALFRKASHAIWIDSLCLPQQQISADMCIHNMGKIYREATQVFVVLSTDCENTVLKISNKKPLNINDYVAIATDDWIDRVWTYQEFANSKSMFILAEGKGNTFISEHHFLSAIMKDAIAYENIKDIGLYQKLERFQMLIAEQQLGKKSAFQVMSATQERSSEGEKTRNRINVMIYLIAGETTFIQDQSLTTLVNKFMNICEENDDFSFIFSKSPRSNVSGRKWRPMDDQIKPVISNLSTFGPGLSGILTDTHLQMNNMCRMVPVNSRFVVTAVENFLKTNFPKAILERLRELGFTGCGECLKLEHGYFFPQVRHKRSSNLFVAISHNVSFPTGAPGLLLRSTNTNINQFCDTGVFIGKAPTISVAINVC